MSRWFVCAACGERFESAWSDDEALDEALELFPAEIEEGEKPAVVCDDCWQTLWASPPRPVLDTDPL